MKNVLTTFIVMIFIIKTSIGQITFQKGYGGSQLEEAKSIQQTFDHGYIIAGLTLSYGQGASDAYLIKTDSSGNVLWAKSYGDSYENYIYSVIQSADSGIVAVGYTQNTGTNSRDIYLLKTNLAGTLLWSKMIGWNGNDEGYSVKQTNDGGYIISGLANENGGVGAFLVKTDAIGDVTWTKKYDDVSSGGYIEFGSAVEQTSDGGYIMAGQAENSFCAGGSDMYLTKTDSSGMIQWNKLYGGLDQDFAYSVKQTTDGGYIMAGYTLSFGTGNEDVCLVKTDSNGDTLWCKTFGGALRDYTYSVAEASDSGFILTGYTESFGGGGNDYYLIKVNVNGVLQWSKTFGGNSDERAFEVKRTTDGGYIIAGYTDGFGLDATSFYVVKTDSMGNSGCNQGNAITTTGICPFTLSTPIMTTGTGGTYSNVSTLVSNGGSDTAFCVSIPTGLKDIENLNSVLIYPNPFTSQINLTGISQGAQIEIYDPTGKRISEIISQSDRQNLNTENLQSGIYFIRYTENTKSISVRLIKL